MSTGPLDNHKPWTVIFPGLIKMDQPPGNRPYFLWKIEQILVKYKTSHPPKKIRRTIYEDKKNHTP